MLHQRRPWLRLPRLVDEEDGMTDDPTRFNQERQRTWIQRIRWLTVLALLLFLFLLIGIFWITGLLTYWYGLYQIARFRSASNITWPISTDRDMQAWHQTNLFFLHNTSLTCVTALDVNYFVKLLLWRNPTTGITKEWMNPWWEPAIGAHRVTYLESSKWCRQGQIVPIQRWDSIVAWRLDIHALGSTLQWTPHVLMDEEAVCMQHAWDLFSGTCHG